MNAKVVSGVGILFAIFACGGTSGNPGNGDAGNTNFTLTINVSGAGSVTTPDGTINCATAACTHSIASGTAVHLVANPAAGTQFTGWTGACSGTGACDLTISADTTVGATFSVLISVELDGAGGGHVTSSPSGIDCTKTPSNNVADVGTGTCSMVVANGTAVTLTATADATSNFLGYGGSVCHGTSCALTATAAAKIFVDFESKTPSNVQHTLTVTVTGSGTVASQPAAIACPGTCAAPFAEGSAVVLVATPASGATFTGWTGACTGATDCSVTMAADETVTATFETVAADACTGLLPALPAAQSFTATTPDGGTCLDATSDGAGTVYVEAAVQSNFTISSSAAAPFNDVLFFLPLLEDNVTIPLATGFVGIAKDGDATTASVAYSASGAIVSSVSYGPGGLNGRGVNANGGTIAVSATCDFSDTNNPKTTFTFQRFDDQNQVTSTQTFSEATCPSLGNGIHPIVDQQGNLLLVYPVGGQPPAGTAPTFGIAVARFAARWFNSSGAPLTDWFDAGAIQPHNPVQVRPLIGGGAALRSGDGWIATLPSGTATPAAAPAGFESLHDAVIARGGKAYAMIPDPGTSGSVDIVAPAGKSCGALTSDANATFFTGKDGTLIKLGGTASCTATYYSQALK